MVKSIYKVSYFKNLFKFSLCEVIFSLKTTFFHEGEILQKIGDNIDSIFFVEFGIVEVVIYLDR